MEIYFVFIHFTLSELPMEFQSEFISFICFKMELHKNGSISFT